LRYSINNFGHAVQIIGWALRYSMKASDSVNVCANRRAHARIEAKQPNSKTSDLQLKHVLASDAQTAFDPADASQFQHIHVDRAVSEMHRRRHVSIN